MNDGLTVTRVWQIAAPVAADEGMEIIDIELRREAGKRGRVLRLYLDKEGGPNLDDLTRISRQLSDLLDAELEVSEPYTLEVSSPGVNRLLRRVEHFVRFVGKRVRVRTREAVEGRRSFLGLLKEVDGGEIVVVQEGTEFRIPLSLIERANYEHDWSA
ncbi:MAG: ribosome maturation factor RimP [Deltaproteobacteria bacterium]|nr:ribosome maturation factor RimP [Deltaproteobacteria bacterium]